MSIFNRLEDRVLGLTQQLTDLQKRNDELLRSRALCKVERERILRRYQELHRVGFPTMRIEKDFESWSTDTINVSQNFVE